MRVLDDFIVRIEPTNGRGRLVRSPRAFVCSITSPTLSLISGAARSLSFWMAFFSSIVALRTLDLILVAFFVPAIAFLASLRSAEHRERATDGSCALSASVTAARVVALDLQGAPRRPHLHPVKPQDR